MSNRIGGPTVAKGALLSTDDVPELETELASLEWLARACRSAPAAHLAWQRGRGASRLAERSDCPGDARLLATVGHGLYQIGGVA